MTCKPPRRRNLYVFCDTNVNCTQPRKNMDVQEVAYQCLASCATLGCIFYVICRRDALSRHYYTKHAQWFSVLLMVAILARVPFPTARSGMASRVTVDISRTMTGIFLAQSLYRLVAFLNERLISTLTLQTSKTVPLSYPSETDSATSSARVPHRGSTLQVPTESMRSPRSPRSLNLVSPMIHSPASAPTSTSPPRDSTVRFDLFKIANLKRRWARFGKTLSVISITHALVRLALCAAGIYMNERGWDMEADRIRGAQVLVAWFVMAAGVVLLAYACYKLHGVIEQAIAIWHDKDSYLNVASTARPPLSAQLRLRHANEGRLILEGRGQTSAFIVLIMALAFWLAVTILACSERVFASLPANTSVDLLAEWSLIWTDAISTFAAHVVLVFMHSRRISIPTRNVEQILPRPKTAQVLQIYTPRIPTGGDQVQMAEVATPATTPVTTAAPAAAPGVQDGIEHIHHPFATSGYVEPREHQHVHPWQRPDRAQMLDCHGLTMHCPLCEHSSIAAGGIERHQLSPPQLPHMQPLAVIGPIHRHYHVSLSVSSENQTQSVGAGSALDAASSYPVPSPVGVLLPPSLPPQHCPTPMSSLILAIHVTSASGHEHALVAGDVGATPQCPV